jgi:hypothetical protein
LRPSQVGDDKFRRQFRDPRQARASMTDYLGGLYCKMAFVCGPRPGAATPPSNWGWPSRSGARSTSFSPTSSLRDRRQRASRRQLGAPTAWLHPLRPLDVRPGRPRLQAQPSFRRRTWTSAGFSRLAPLPRGGAEPDPSASPSSESHQPPAFDLRLHKRDSPAWWNMVEIERQELQAFDPRAAGILSRTPCHWLSCLISPWRRAPPSAARPTPR